MLYAATLVAIPIALALAFDVPGVNDLAPLEGFGDMAIDTAWLPFSVLFSAAAAWGVATNYGMRCGGFVGAAFIGMFMGDPWQVIVAGTIAAATYLIVTRLLMNHMILFGRRKFSSMLLVGSSLSWILLWSGREFFGPEVQHHLDLGSLALTPLFLPGLIANDVQRTSPRKVVLGVAMASTFVLTWTWWAQSLFEGLALALVWKVVRRGRLRRHLLASSRPGATDATPPTTPPTTRTDNIVHCRTARPFLSASPALPTGVAAAFGMGGYRRWAAAHPAAAQAAERWLTALVGEGTAGVPALALPAGCAVDIGLATPTTWRPETSATQRLRAPQIRAAPEHPPWPARSGRGPQPLATTIARRATYQLVRAGSTPCGPGLPRMIRAPRGARGRVARR